jgi:hypothetical protein
MNVEIGTEAAQFPEKEYIKMGFSLQCTRYENPEKKENQIFFIYKEIQKGAVAKSYLRKSFLIYD